MPDRVLDREITVKSYKKGAIACLVLMLSACAGTGVDTVEEAVVSRPLANVTMSDKQRYEEIRQHLLKKEYSLAEAKLQNLLIKFPDHSGALANLGLIYSETNRLDKAEKTLEKAINIDRTNPQIYLRLAHVYKLQGKLVKALEAYRKTIDADAKNAKAHYNIAILYDLYLQDKPSAILHVQSYQDITGNKDKETSLWLKQLERDISLQQRAEN